MVLAAKRTATLVALFVVLAAVYVCQAQEDGIVARKALAIAVLASISNDSSITGYVGFEQFANSAVRVKVMLSGLEPNTSYAIRLHRFGDLRGFYENSSFTSVGGLFVPDGWPAITCPEEVPNTAWAGDWNSSDAGTIDEGTTGGFVFSLNGSETSIIGLSAVLYNLNSNPSGCVADPAAFEMSALAVGVVGLQALTGTIARASPQYTEAVCVLQQVAPCTGKKCLLGSAGLVLLRQNVMDTNDTNTGNISVVAQVSVPGKSPSPAEAPVPAPVLAPEPVQIGNDTDGNETTPEAVLAPEPIQMVNFIDGNDTDGNETSPEPVPVPEPAPSVPVPEPAPSTPVHPSESRGIQVYTWGDLSTDNALGDHFNPDGHDHGLPNSPLRHVGDFGRIYFDSNGVGTYHYDLTYPNDQLSIPNLIGRAIVVHVDTDHGNDPSCPDAKLTGNAGAPLYVCVIGVANNLALPDLSNITVEEVDFTNIPCEVPAPPPPSTGGASAGPGYEPSRTGLGIAIVVMAFFTVFGFIVGLYVGVRCKQQNDAYRAQ